MPSIWKRRKGQVLAKFVVAALGAWPPFVGSAEKTDKSKNGCHRPPLQGTKLNHWRSEVTIDKGGVTRCMLTMSRKRSNR